MAKGTAKVSSKQKSISSYFGGKNKKEESSDVDMESDDAQSVDEDDTKTRPTSGKTANPGSSDLPPINNIPAMFSDIVSRIPKIKEVAEHIQGRKLRVATMCSGTESPLLALELIRRSILEHYEVQFSIEHVFSCEIEPFKQAYIERNFHPPLLFRDVCELGNDKACVFFSLLRR
jgi:hypothetical protein